MTPPPSLLRYIQTRDKRIHKLYVSQPKAMTELFDQLMAGQAVKVGGRASCGGKVDPSWVFLAAWREIIKQAGTFGIRVSVSPVKHGNGWATKCGGFWDEADYCLDK